MTKNWTQIHFDISTHIYILTLFARPRIDQLHPLQRGKILSHKKNPKKKQ